MNDPTPLRTGVERLLRHLRAPPADHLRGIFERWPELVGPGAADHSRPLALEGSTLVVAVSDSAWASHFRWAEGEILDRLAARLGGGGVDGLRVVVRPLDDG